uniref:S1 motif domain-containing protein n=1 Tax=Globodera pallida TaxID=36090 RepID=A0A183BR51_GLOPA
MFKDFEDCKALDFTVVTTASRDRMPDRQPVRGVLVDRVTRVNCDPSSQHEVLRHARLAPAFETFRPKEGQQCRTPDVGDAVAVATFQHSATPDRGSASDEVRDELEERRACEAAK